MPPPQLPSSRDSRDGDVLVAIARLESHLGFVNDTVKRIEVENREQTTKLDAHTENTERRFANIEHRLNQMDLVDARRSGFATGVWKMAGIVIVALSFVGSAIYGLVSIVKEMFSGP